MFLHKNNNNAKRKKQDLNIWYNYDIIISALKHVCIEVRDGRQRRLMTTDVYKKNGQIDFIHHKPEQIKS